MSDPELKERIIQAAVERFFTHGFSKVTMDELAAELGISKKTMYQYFRSKDDLLDAVVSWMIIRVGARLSQIMASSGSFVDKLYDLWMLVGEILSRFSRQMQDDLRRFRPDLWKRIDDTRREKILANFSQIVEEGIRSGLIREDVNREILTHIYLGAVQGTVNPEILVRSSFSAADAFRTILQVMLEGILTDRARGEFQHHIAHSTPARQS